MMPQLNHSQDEDNTQDEVDLATLNRHALVLEPSPAFLEWHQQISAEELPLTTEDSAPTVYLIPEHDSQPETWLRRNFMTLFENELGSWCLDQSLWPRNRSLEMFSQLFRIRFSSIVLDFGRGPIGRDEA